MFKKIPLTPKACYWYIFAICSGLLGFAIYLQTVMLLAPCPLCELQRLMFLLIAFTALLAALSNLKKQGMRWFSSIIMLFSLAGALLAAHQVWLEFHPPANPNSCGMDLSYLFSILPFTTALKAAIMGSGDCAAVTWRLLGLSIPSWSCIAFVFLGLFSIYPVKTASK